MIPIRDNIPPRSFPWVNYGLIAVSSAFFLVQVLAPRGEDLIERFGMIPARVVNPDQVILRVEPVLVQSPFGVRVVEESRELGPSAVPPWLTLLTCIFLHGGWMHAIGNLWFLHIFGDNVEDRLGHIGYVVFYLGCGLVASITHLLAGPDSTIPTIGASGAIAGVMGAYLILYPKALVVSVIPIIFIMQVVVIPAPIFLGIWFAFQFLQGASSLTQSEGGGGVAWWAHVGGFVAGVAVSWLLKVIHVARPPVLERRLRSDRMTSYRA